MNHFHEIVRENIFRNANKIYVHHLLTFRAGDISAADSTGIGYGLFDLSHSFCFVGTGSLPDPTDFDGRNPEKDEK